MNRRRALSFGGVAAAVRPRASVVSARAHRPADGVVTAQVLDVGCGTGKASRLMIARGCDVLGVEPDPSMAAIARSHGVTVEAGTFEEWDSQQTGCSTS